MPQLQWSRKCRIVAAAIVPYDTLAHTMHIVIATPLYPPDRAEPASYVKELAKRIGSTHRVFIVTYGNIPEKIRGVTIVSTSKQRPLLIRLLFYTIALFRACRDADVLYAQSGSSAGLPILFVHLFRRIPLVMHFIEDEAWERAKEEGHTTKSISEFHKVIEGSVKIRFIAWLQKALLRRAHTIIVSTKELAEVLAKHYRIVKERINTSAVKERPEILPFTPFPKEALAAYEASWGEHVATLEKILFHGNA